MSGNGPTGVTCDFFFYNSAGLVWNVPTSAYVAWVDGNIANYRIAATENGTSGTFTAASVPALSVWWELRMRGAAVTDSPAVDSGAIVSSSGGGTTIELTGANIQIDDD